MKTRFNRRVCEDYLVMVVQAVLLALSYQVFILSNSFAPTGINGLATMAQHLFDFSMGYISFFVNFPLAMFCFVFVNRQFSLKTLTFSVVFSGVLLLFQNNVIDIQKLVYVTNDGRSTILAPVASGAINGLVYGATIRRGGSTGGMDFIAAYIHQRKPEYSLVHILFAINTAVACLSYFVYDFNIEPVILCIIYNVITTTVSDRILAGGKQAVKIELITDHPKELTEMLIRCLHHSATIIQAEGGYSHQPKTMLVCVINKHQIPQFSKIIALFPGSFAIMTTVTETLGNFNRSTK